VISDEIVVDRTESGQTVFELRDVTAPEPKVGEVVVRVRASAMNRGELLASIGWHSADVTKRAGRELAGEVCATLRTSTCLPRANRCGVNMIHQ
jgi:NADPH:quinone reductase-like Zn-dependent oxidoreductase